MEEESGLKQRSKASSHEIDDKSKLVSSAPPKLEGNKGVAESVSAWTNPFVTQIAEHPVLLQVVATLQQLRPLFLKLQELFYFLVPYFIKFVQLCQIYWKKLEPYHPEEFAPALFGLFMTFFGGFYFTTFAAIEAYKVVGWEPTVKFLGILYEDIKKVYSANTVDNEVDDDGNGIADVLEMDAKTLALRKVNLVLITLDPLAVMGAVNGILTGFLAVVATLKIEFAQTITIGIQIGKRVEAGLEHFVVPILAELIPVPYRKWIPVIVMYTSRTIGVSIAWTFQRVRSAFYAAYRGADLFTRGTFKFLRRNNWITEGQADLGSGFVSIFVLAFGTIGFFWQIFQDFTFLSHLTLSSSQ